MTDRVYLRRLRGIQTLDELACERNTKQFKETAAEAENLMKTAESLLTSGNDLGIEAGLEATDALRAFLEKELLEKLLGDDSRRWIIERLFVATVVRIDRFGETMDAVSEIYPEGDFPSWLQTMVDGLIEEVLLFASTDLDTAGWVKHVISRFPKTA